jgi:hypothetical protein
LSTVLSAHDGSEVPPGRYPRPLKPAETVSRAEHACCGAAARLARSDAARPLPIVRHGETAPPALAEPTGTLAQRSHAVSGFSQGNPGNRAKSQSAEHRLSPRSIAKAVRCTSGTKFACILGSLRNRPSSSARRSGGSGTQAFSQVSHARDLVPCIGHRFDVNDAMPTAPKPPRGPAAGWRDGPHAAFRTTAQADIKSTPLQVNPRMLRIDDFLCSVVRETAA